MLRRFLLATPLIVAAWACGDLKSASPSPSGDGGTSSSSSSSGTASSSGATSSSGGSSSGSSTTSSSGSTSSGGLSGPGPHGALPNGYCCTGNGDCRYRHCVGGVCKDECSGGNESCTRPDLPNWTCDAANQFSPGICEPPSGFTCMDASRYLLGKRAAGECCTATGTNVSGLECSGGRCLTIGAEGNNNPFVCTNACDQPGDCDSGFVCNSDIGACIPGNDPYTCK